MRHRPSSSSMTQGSETMLQSSEQSRSRSGPPDSCARRPGPAAPADRVAWAPEFIRGDNGSEFIEGSLQGSLEQAGIKTLYLEPGSPWQNGYIESFHCRFREECLDREQLWRLSEARMVLEDWRIEYNHLRPYECLNLETPKAFAAKTQGGSSSRATPSPRTPLDNIRSYHRGTMRCSALPGNSAIKGLLPNSAALEIQCGRRVVSQ